MAVMVERKVGQNSQDPNLETLTLAVTYIMHHAPGDGQANLRKKTYYVMSHGTSLSHKSHLGNPEVQVLGLDTLPYRALVITVFANRVDRTNIYIRLG
jgi:hypothetical protein